MVEDIDYDGCFTWPEQEAFRRYGALYCEVVRRRGGDPNIGPRLPQLLRDAGFEHVGVSLNQPVGFDGGAKHIHVLTLENIADALVQASLATRADVDQLLEQLQAIAADTTVLAALPRIFQSWGRRGATGSRTG